MKEQLLSLIFNLPTFLAVKTSVTRPVLLDRKGAEVSRGGWMCPISATGSRSL